MTFRNLDVNGDWSFGSGRNNYVRDEQEIALNLKTRVLSFLGDCFFATNEGIDWWNLLDYRYQDRLENSVQDVIINTPGVTGINSVDAVVGANRKIIISYNIQTIFSDSYTGEIIPLQNAA
nr:MAG TPA: baseplate wedge protein [Caudoviricetes sp.]